MLSAAVILVIVPIVRAYVGWPCRPVARASMFVCDFRGKLIHEYMLRLVYRIQIIGDVRL